MKKIALSLVVIAGSGAYIWDRSGAAAPDDLLAPTAPVVDVRDAAVPRRKPALLQGEVAHARPISFVIDSPSRAQFPPAAVQPPRFEPAPAIADAGPPADRPVIPASVAADVPLPRPRPTPPRLEAPTVVPAVMAAPAPSGYADGSFTGPVADAYYGLVQVQAQVQGGRLVGIKVLRYPSDRRTSVYINRHALPMLRDEVISAQNADVDIISGATLTSRAFIRSLDGALRKAGT